MGEKFDFRDLFIFDLANNHQGSVEHGLDIIREVGDVVRRHGIRGAVKFQFRQIETFIHPGHRTGSPNKHIPRFIETRLSPRHYGTLLREIRRQGLIAICTPFDEDSVGVIDEMGFDVIKVASSSARDWPLLERIADSDKPVIYSTGGLTLRNIDDLNSFFGHRGVDNAIMHCVSIYPIPDAHFNLNQLDELRIRYPDKVIGWSTHERPEDLTPVQIAVAKGARMFERHVGKATDTIRLNAYSSTAEQIDRWLEAYKRAVSICGPAERPPVTEPEQASIESLKRGIYARKKIKEGEVIRRNHVYFSMPCAEGQLDSGQWREGIVSSCDISPDSPLIRDLLRQPDPGNLQILKKAIHEVKALLNRARIPLNSEFKVEYSHHYGISKFREVGAVLITCINREYCKKLIVQIPGQTHPSHFHKRKEETFQVLYGVLQIEVDGHRRELHPGQTVLIQPGVWHSFRTETGAIFEEISTTHYQNDSYYKDKVINKQGTAARKTEVEHWGRFQLLDIERD